MSATTSARPTPFDMPANAQAGALPDWFVAAMPHGYQTRLAEIQRLTTELEAMDRFGRIMLETGPRLAQSVGALFADLKYEVAPLSDASTVAVKLEGKRRLLMCASQDSVSIGRKSPDVARA